MPKANNAFPADKRLSEADIHNALVSDRGDQYRLGQ